MTNLGTILRAGEGAGNHRFGDEPGYRGHLQPKVIPPWGSISGCPFAYVDDLSAALAQIVIAGVWPFAAHLKRDE